MLNHAVEKSARIRIRLRAPDLPGLHNTSSYRGVGAIKLEGTMPSPISLPFFRHEQGHCPY